MRIRAWGIVIVAAIALSASFVLVILLLWQDPAAAPTPSPGPSPEPTSTTAVTLQATLTPTLPPAPSPTPPTLMEYIVQPGDTLGAIAQAYDVSIVELMEINDLTNPDVLQAGQVLLIPVQALPTETAGPMDEAPPAETLAPEPAPTPEQAQGPPPTLTPSGPPLVEIAQVLGAGDLASEVLIVRNRGGRADLEGWTLSGSGGSTFTFPALVLFEGGEVRVHSGPGSSTARDLYWARSTPAWGTGELITLHDDEGNAVGNYIVP